LTSIDRRPASIDVTRVDDADFTDRTIGVSETEEEAVVGKTPAGGKAPSMLPPALPRLFKDSVFRSSNATGRVKANLSLVNHSNLSSCKT
jgi:hypothetical protein